MAFDLETEIVLECSRDGGKTWSPERGRVMGNDGEYTHRVVWRRNGRYDRFAVFRFSTKVLKKVAVGQLTITAVPGE